MGRTESRSIYLATWENNQNNKLEMKKGFRISRAAEVTEKMNSYRERGALQGVYLGFPNMAKHYSMALPGVTDWTGFPRSGKTEVLTEFLMNTSIFHGWKHLVYFPDVGNEDEVYSDLIHKYTGKTFDKRYKNLITEEEIARATPWVTEHFKVLVKDDPKAKLTPYEFWDLCVEEKEISGIQTGSIDAWKDMSHAREKEFGRTDQYLEDVLAYRNAIAEKHFLHLHTIVHPTKTDKDATGNRKAPLPYDIKGGTEWFNNGKSMVTVHRPMNEKTKVEISFNKIKPRSIGSEGKIELDFDIRTRRYFFEDMGTAKFSDNEEETTKNEQLQMNIDEPEEDNDVPF
jgi:hypothetical protein